MYKYILKRLLMMIPVLLGVTFIVFFILNLSPGDPAAMILGDQASEEALEMKREELGLNDPLLVRYGRYVVNMVQGDLGTSYKNDLSVWDQVMERFPNTAVLAVAGILVALIIGIPTGIISAKKQYSAVDNVSMVLSLIGVSMPVFMTALVLQYLFAFKFKWFPVSGFDSFRAMILPAIVLGWNSAGSIARMTRSNLVEIMQNDFIRTARAKGLLESGVIVKHALKNAMLPVVTMMALQVSSMLSGAVLTESVFGVPGIGRLAVNAIETRDMPLLQGTVIFTTILIIVGNLVADLLYNVLDPRIREGA